MKWFQNNKAAPIWLHLPSHNGSKDLPSGQRKQGKIARELTMMRFIYHLFNSVSIPYVILDEYILSFKYTYIEKKIIFFSHSKHKHGNTKDDFNILK